MRVVLNVNVLVSIAIGSKRLEPIREAWESGRFTLLVSPVLLDELRKVLVYPHLARYLSPDAAALFVRRVAEVGEAVEVAEPYPASPDPGDAYLLAMLRDADAELLVTGDRALLAMSAFVGKAIRSPAAFIAELGATL